VRYLVAPDSYKGTLTALEAARIIADAIRSVDRLAEIDMCPLSDGGEGLLEAINARIGGSLVPCPTVDASGRAITARWLHLPDSETAVLESAACLGLSLLTLEDRCPQRASSEGLGLMIRAVSTFGCRHVMIGLGGSATNDCGYGLARALGYSLQSIAVETGRGLTASLRSVARIVPPTEPVIPPHVEVVVLADVTNPLLGPSGATYTYAEQKGALVEDLPLLEEGIRHFSTIIRRDIADIDPMLAGMGAAGGLGFALSAFCRARIIPGAGYVIDATDFHARCARADVVITGEGRLDAQTLYGKVIHHVADAGRLAGKPVVAIVGSCDGDTARIGSALGLDRIHVMTSHPTESDLQIDIARSNLKKAATDALKAVDTF